MYFEYLKLRQEVKKMRENKSNQMLIRLSPYESGLLTYVAEQAGLSRAEILRLGLRIIARASDPKEVRELQRFYKQNGGAKNE